MENNKYYITTPIYYTDGRPHLGHAYTTIAADILARNNRLLGKDVFFLTGTDEHGQKVEKESKARGIQPQELVDDLAEIFKNLFKKLDISFNYFIRTTDVKHIRAVEKLFMKIYQKGDIYKGDYSGLYCTDCESYYTEKDVIDGCCPVHKKKLDILEEETYFFRLSKYQDYLIELFEKNKEFIAPNIRRSEIINKVKEGLRDVSITRESCKWGITAPINKNHTLWVWVDALPNYISAIEYPDGPKFKYWPADVHLIGKDIQWHHMILWPAMLKSAGIKPPKKVFSHGWLKLRGEKLSKAGKIIVDPEELAKEYSPDVIRYFLMSRMTFGQDSEFSKEDLINAINKDLADNFGNLVNRTIMFTNRTFEGKIPNSDKSELSKEIDKINSIPELINKFEFLKALANFLEASDNVNKYMQERKPWEMKKGKDLEKIIYSLNDFIARSCYFIYPFMPSSAKKIAETYGIKIDSYPKTSDKVIENNKLKSSRLILFEKKK